MPRVGRNRNKNLRMPVGWAPSPSGVIYFRPTNQADRAIVRAITGGRLSLRLGATLSSAQDDGLHLRRAKGDRELVLVWDRRLRRMWHRLMRWRAAKKRDGKLQTTMAILNRRGRRVTVTGFNSAWRRAMERAGLAGAFTFHDLRASRASTLTAEQATEVLAHDDAATTRRIYRRGPLRIALSDGISENLRKLPEFTKEKAP